MDASAESLCDELAAVVGDRHVIAPGSDQEPYVVDWRGRYRGRANLAGIALTTFTGVMVSLTKGSFFIPLAVAGIISILGAASDLFIVGEIAPLRPRDEGMRLPEPVKAVA